MHLAERPSACTRSGQAHMTSTCCRGYPTVTLPPYNNVSMLCWHLHNMVTLLYGGSVTVGYHTLSAPMSPLARLAHDTAGVSCILLSARLHVREVRQAHMHTHNMDILLDGASVAVGCRPLTAAAPLSVMTRTHFPFLAVSRTKLYCNVSMLHHPSICRRPMRSAAWL